MTSLEQYVHDWTETLIEQGQHDPDEVIDSTYSLAFA